MKKEERFEKVLSYFREHNPDAQTELTYKSPYELAVAVVLSAQCTDKRVNMITPDFFRVFPGLTELAQADSQAVFGLIKSCSYPNNKTRNLIAMAQTVLQQFGGNFPEEVTELQKIPGIGRKTANVLASVLFNKPALAVDTHVFRVAARIGLTTRAKNPLQAENQLIKYIPENQRSVAHHWLILHGRYVCMARNPKCASCGLANYCKYFLTKFKGRIC